MDKPENERPAVATFFEKLISAKLYVRFTRGLHRVVDLFNKSSLHLHLAHLGVILAGSACGVKGVKIGR